MCNPRPIRMHLPLWIPTGLALVWLCLFPLWQDGSYLHITRAKWIGMLIFTGVTLLATAVMLIILQRQKRLGDLLLHPAASLGLAYFVLVALSAALGTWRTSLNGNGQLTVLFGATRYEGLITQLCYCAIFLCMAAMRGHMPVIVSGAAVVLTAYTVIAALQYLGYNPLGLFPGGLSIRTNYEFQGTIGNIDMVVGYISLIAPLCLGSFVQMRRGGWRLLIAGCCGVLLTLCMNVQCGLIALAAMLLLLTMHALRKPQTRGRTLFILAGCALTAALRTGVHLPWLDGGETLSFIPNGLMWGMLTLAGALMALGVLLLRRPGKALQTRFVLLLAFLLIAAVLLAAYLAPIPEGNGLWELQRILHGEFSDDYGSERIGVWRLTLGMCAESPQALILGHGPDTFLYAMDEYRQITGQTLHQRFDNPHNLLLAILANNGLIALIAFIALCACAAAFGWRSSMPLTLSVVCYLTQGMFTFSICLVTPMFWCVLGLLTAALPTTSIQKGLSR